MRGSLTALAVAVVLIVSACSVTTSDAEDATADATATEASTSEPEPTSEPTDEPTDEPTPEPTDEPTDEREVPESADDLVAGARAFFTDLELDCLSPAGADGSWYCVGGDTCGLELIGDPAYWGCTDDYPASGGVYATIIAQSGGQPSVTLELEWIGAGELPAAMRELMTAFVSRVCILTGAEAGDVVDDTFDGTDEDGCVGIEGAAMGTLGGFVPSEESPPHWYLGGYANFMLADPAP